MLEILKEEVIDIASKAENEGLCRHRSGNFSIRDKKTNYICITPSGVKRDDLNKDAIVVVDIDGNIIENKLSYKPSSELLMHIAAYKTRDDVYGVCHTHAIYATIFAILSMEIRPIVFEAIDYKIHVPIAKYATPGSKELANSIIEPLKVSDACLLEKHGVLTVGPNLDEAYLKMEYVEDVAKLNYFILAIGKKPQEIPLSEFNKVLNP